eukprot:TRINITY_DN136444_c0_g1_i1.p2 TRINITY_DN136444_c0_g1~~TRINITY_DN136444_c0_g1_i1.p2  ORF type:complete len:251 (+),score=44.56 TRINITY_DN136444_c0_g1_i1:461-1213(+)
MGPHQYHTAILFTQAEEHLKERFGGAIKEQQEVVERIAKMKAVLSGKREGLASTLTKSKSTISEGFAKLHSQLLQKEKETMDSLDKTYNSLLQPHKKIDYDLATIEEKVKAAQKGLSEAIALSNTQDGYDQLNQVKLPDIAAIQTMVDSIEAPIASAANSLPDFTLGFDLVKLGIDEFVTFGEAKENTGKFERVRKYLEEDKAATETMEKMRLEIIEMEKKDKRKLKSRQKCRMQYMQKDYVLEMLQQLM